MMISLPHIRSMSIHQSVKIFLFVLSITFMHFSTDYAYAAQTPDTVKKARQACSRLAEKIANTRKLKNNTVQSASNYNADKDTCFAQIEISQVLQSKNENQNESQSEGQSAEQNEKRHRQVVLMNATENTILAIVMWEEPKGLRVGHVYDPSYDGPRDEYEKVEAYMRKKMALNLR
jgi:septal ring factor EnvC (AmiA/AmiB activator)